MPCYTRIKVSVPEDRWTRKAAKALEATHPSITQALKEGNLTRTQARALQKEARILKGIAEVRRLSPTAVIRRKGDEITVTAEA